VKLDLGRAFAFSYGDKENGAVFAHMDVMFAFALYQRGLVKEGYAVLNGLFRMASGEHARTYPCLSEYYDAADRGLYNYLTGSASWYTYLLITQSFGIRHFLGDLLIQPRLLKEQFGKEGVVALSLAIDGKPCTVTYRNPKKKEYGAYAITAVTVNGETVPADNLKTVVIAKDDKRRLLSKKQNTIEITLG
jgi:cellobiose phosphorylase